MDFTNLKKKLFGKKGEDSPKDVVVKSKKKEAPKAPTKKKAPEKAPLSGTGKMLRETRLESILIRPRYTEKSATLSEKGVYVFEVSERANKTNVAHAIELQYNVKPMSVRMVSKNYKPVSERRYKGNSGVRRSNKKAYVKLKKGDTISFS